MKKIKLFLEYQCYPMWIYNEKGELIDNNLAKELVNDAEISRNLKEIQEIYNNLFEDNEVNFEYKGFISEAEKMSFLEKTDRIAGLIKNKLGNDYLIENKVSI